MARIRWRLEIIGASFRMNEVGSQTALALLFRQGEPVGPDLFDLIEIGRCLFDLRATVQIPTNNPKLGQTTPPAHGCFSARIESR